MKDRDRLEKNRRQEKLSDYNAQIDKPMLGQPDPNSSHFLEDKLRRQQEYKIQQEKIDRKRVEKYERDMNRWKSMEEEEEKKKVRYDINFAQRVLKNKNQGGQAFNIVNLSYDQDDRGHQLMAKDQGSRYRWQLRSKNMDSNSNSGYNPITGAGRYGTRVDPLEYYQPESKRLQQVQALDDSLARQQDMTQVSKPDNGSKTPLDNIMNHSYMPADKPPQVPVQQSPMINKRTLGGQRNSVPNQLNSSFTGVGAAILGGDQYGQRMSSIDGNTNKPENVGSRHFLGYRPDPSKLLDISRSQPAAGVSRRRPESNIYNSNFDLYGIEDPRHMTIAKLNPQQQQQQQYLYSNANGGAGVANQQFTQHTSQMKSTDSINYF